MRRYDLVVLGGGTAGIVASLSAALVGARVALLERDRTGGDCLWTGCVPSKALLAAARRAHLMRTADQVGLTAVEPEVDLGSVMAHVRASQRTIAPDDSPERLRRAGVEVVHAAGRFLSDDRIVTDDGRRLGFRRALIATGGRPRLPGIDGLREAEALTSDTVWALERLPPRLLVIGGGPVGCELGQALQRLGSRVTIVEATAGLLPAEEPEAGDLVARRLRAEGADVRLDTTVARIRPEEAGWRARLTTPDGEPAPEPREVTVDEILVATGRGPVSAGLGLAAVGVATESDGAVRVDPRLRTTNPRIYAAGDVTGRLPFTHVAGHEAALAVANALFGLRRTLRDEAVPWVTFTDPEVARVGACSQQARSRWGEDASVHHVDHDDLDRGVVTGETAGFTKLVADPRGRLVGATIVGPRAGETVAEAALLVRTGHTIRQLASLVHAYPTFTEAIRDVGSQALRERLGRPAPKLLARTALGTLRRLDGLLSRLP